MTQTAPKSRRSTEQRLGLIARLMLPSFGSWSVLFVFYLLVLSAHKLLLDSDTGWHIRTGELIWQMRAAPRYDPFSFTLAGHGWFAWEWLTDLLMAGLHAWRGLPGVVAGAFFVLLLASAVLYHLMIKRGAHPVIAFLITAFGANASIVHWLARPHLLSILMMVVWYAMVESYRRDRTKWIYLTPVVIALWANLHGAFVATFAILAVYAVGELIEIAARSEGKADSGSEDRKSWREVWRNAKGWQMLVTYAAVGAASFIASLATPYGFNLYRHLWRYLGDNELLASIQEFQSPSFHAFDGKLIEVLLLLGVIAAVNALRQRRFVEAGLFILWAHLTLKSERHVTLAVVILAPIIAEQLSRLIAELLTHLAQGETVQSVRWRSVARFYDGVARIDRQLTGAFVYVAVIALVIAVSSSQVGGKLLALRFDPKRHPVEAADFILKSELAGNMYSGDQFGGYLIYRLYPKFKVFVDGRNDFYRQGKALGNDVLQDVDTLSAVKPRWAEVLKRRDIKWMVLRRDEPLSLISQMSGEWKVAYQDRTAQILVKTDSPGSSSNPSNSDNK